MFRTTALALVLAALLTYVAPPIVARSQRGGLHPRLHHQWLANPLQLIFAPDVSLCPASAGLSFSRGGREDAYPAHAHKF
jgi:hypothetical protein